MAEAARLGFVGLGLMGAPMVRRLLGQGRQVAVWNREPERYAEVGGARWAESPASVRAASDVVLFCVLDGEAVEACCFGPGGLVEAGGGARLLIDTSTIGPVRTRAMAARLWDAAGMGWVDAPISGGPGPAELGQLTIMAGGTAAAFAVARPVLAQLAANLTHAGPLGAGQTAKLVNQAIVGVSYVLMAEVLALVRATEMDPARLPDCLAGGLADSLVLQRIYSQMLARDFARPRGYARQLDKDLADVARFLGERGLALPLVERAIGRYHEYAAENGMQDSASVARLYDKNAEERTP